MPRPTTLTRHKLELVVDVPAELDVDSSDLHDNILDALVAYDDRGLLFNGRRTSEGDSCLTGVSLVCKEIARIRDPYEHSPNVQRSRYWDSCQVELRAEIRFHEKIDAIIDQLQGVRARVCANRVDPVDVMSAAELENVKVRFWRALKREERLLEYLAKAPWRARKQT